MTSSRLVVLALTGAGSCFSAQAATDASGDLLASFTGTAATALDLVDAQVSFDAAANTFTLQARAYGDIASLATGAYVFGFHRGGAANQPFGPIGFGNIAFNATALLRSDGTGNVGASAVSAVVQGDTVRAVLSADLLPSQGAAPQDYTWALWAVDLAVAGLPRNADFISRNNLNVSAVPEPASVALMLAGLIGVGAAARSRRRG